MYSSVTLQRVSQGSRLTNRDDSKRDRGSNKFRNQNARRHKAASRDWNDRPDAR